MAASLAPLELDRDNDIDDVIISAFAVQMVNNQASGGDLNLTTTPPLMDQLSGGSEQEFPERGWTPVVVGRYPARANECNLWQDVSSGVYYTYTTERDPFDYYRQGETPLNGGQGVDVEIVTADPDGAGPEPVQQVGSYPLEIAIESEGNWVTPLHGFDPYDFTEIQRGFVITGQRQVDMTLVADVGGNTVNLTAACWGSDKTVYWMQDRLIAEDSIMTDAEITNMRLTDPDFCRVEVLDADGNPTGVFEDCDQREFMVNQGVVLVEIYWQHQLLLDIPVFSPIYNALNDDQTTIHVWSAFPAPTIEPDLEYNLDASNFIDDID
jgi:hypothetical protein